MASDAFCPKVSKGFLNEVTDASDNTGNGTRVTRASTRILLIRAILKMIFTYETRGNFENDARFILYIDL